MRVVRAFGIEFRLNPFLVLLMLAYASVGLFWETLVAFWVVLLHELAHVAVAACFGFRADAIELMPFGGLASFSQPIAHHPQAELITAAAGPIHNFAHAALVAILHRNQYIAPGLARFLIDTNLAIGIFNLLPALPLDGGRMLRAVLARRAGLAEATAFAVGIGRLAGLAVLGVGAALAYLGRCNVLVPALGGFLAYAAAREGRLAPYDRVRASLRKKRLFLERGAVPAQVVAAQEAAPLRVVASRLEPGKLSVILVFDEHVRLSGVATEVELVEAMVRHGPSAPAGVLVR